jgi:adenylate cyclase
MQPAERQLAAVVAADIAGYSRLMGTDEEGTLARLKACRRDLIDPGIAGHRGRIVKTTGDGFLIEFSSPVEAVRWAVEMQQGMIERNAEIPDERRIRFRVGINLGDVIVDDKDLYGDAVNIAARLETLADPGGICISRAVQEQIRDRLPLPFEDSGEQSVKNIARPIRVYALSADAIATLPKVEMPVAPRPTRPPIHRRPIVAAVAAVGVLIIAGGLWWRWPFEKTPSPTATAPALEKAAVPAAAATPRLSIVVLPFNNLSNDPEQQYFADGVTEDLTTDLSRIAGSFVISRNTAFTYKDKPIDTKQIGRELGVRYVLEGSVQRSGKQVRVNAQLIDAETGAHLWAERFERDIADLFAVQNEITGRIAVELNFALVGVEATRPTNNADARDYILRGRAAYNRPATPAGRAEAIGWFERALALDPHSVEAQSWLALALASRISNGMTDTAAADLGRAEGLIAQALATSPGYPVARYAKGVLLIGPQQAAQHRFADAIPEFEAVIASDRNWAGAITNLGFCKFITGSLEELIPSQEQAIRLSPRDPLISSWYTWIGMGHLLQSRTDEAVLWMEKSRSANPAVGRIHTFLAAAYALKGDSERAAAELAEARKLDRNGVLSSIARLRSSPWNGTSPKILTLLDATYFAGLRKAGVPEE